MLFTFANKLPRDLRESETEAKDNHHWPISYSPLCMRMYIYKQMLETWSYSFCYFICVHVQIYPKYIITTCPDCRNLGFSTADPLVLDNQFRCSSLRKTVSAAQHSRLDYSPFVKCREGFIGGAVLLVPKEDSTQWVSGRFVCERAGCVHCVTVCQWVTMGVTVFTCRWILAMACFWHDHILPVVI